MKLKIECEIEINDIVCDFNDKEEMEWFLEVLKDKNHTSIILFSGEVGDELGTTTDFKFKVLNKDDN